MSWGEGEYRQEDQEGIDVAGGYTDIQPYTVVVLPRYCTIADPIYIDRRTDILPSSTMYTPGLQKPRYALL